MTTTITRYVMTGNVPGTGEAVFWNSYTFADMTGSQSGYGANVLQNIAVSYTEQVPANTATAVANPIGPATGDLTGIYPGPQVSGLQGNPVAATAPSSGQILGWNGIAWAPASPAGDITGAPASNLVSKVQGFPVSSTVPGSDGYALVSSGGTYVPEGVIPQLNVKNFGAKGDGSTNDTVAIQTAINVAASIKGELVFPLGTYMVNSTLTAASTQAVNLRGVSNRNGGVTLTFTAGGSSSLFNATSSTYFRISNMKVFANNAAFTGTLLDLTSANSAHFEEVSFQGTTGSTCTLVKVTNTYDITFKSCAFNYCSIGVYGSPDNSHFANNISFVDCNNGLGTVQNHVIYNPASAWTIDSCVFEGLVNGQGSAVYCDGYCFCLSLIVRGCWIGDDSAAGSTWLNLYGSGMQITGNTFASNYSTCIGLHAIGATITGNTFQGAPKNVNFTAQCQNIIYYANDVSSSSPNIYDGTMPYNAILQAPASTSFAVGAGMQLVHPQTVRGYQQQTQYLTNDAWTELYMDTIDWEATPSSYDGYTYTATTPGYYLVTGTCALGLVTNSILWLSVYKNGAPYPGGYGGMGNALSGQATTIAASVSTVVHLSTNDTIRLYAFQDSGGFAATQYETTHLCVHYLSS